jgi:glycosyltransferase involved in cell wall biosynthesis
MNANTAHYYAWLLRPDVRKATKSEKTPNPAFEAWWLAKGRVEYPGYAALTEQQAAWLREPTGSITAPDLPTPLPVPRAMQLVLQYRPDVRRKYAANTAALAAWFYTAGLNEHLLLPLVDAQWVRLLDAPAGPTGSLPQGERREQGLDSAGRQPAAVPAGTVLMALAWHLLEADQRAALPLNEPAARLRFMSMFFSAVGRSAALQALLARRWHAWLQQEVEGHGPGIARWQQLGLTRPAWLGQPPAANAVLHTSKAPVSWRERPFGVNLYGFAFGELGIGEDVRMAVQACDAVGIPYRVVNVDPGAQLRQADRLLGSHVESAQDAAPYAFNLFCMPGFDMVGRVVMREGQQVLQGHYNIGWWPWELPVWPQRWKPAFDLVQEVWAATRFTEQMYRSATQRAVTWMPLPASVDRLETVSREELGLPRDAFVYLFVFDLNSWLTRKNPMAVIEAFQRAFPDKRPAVNVRQPRRAKTSPKPMLVLKTMNGREGHPVWDDFKARCAHDDRIVLLDRTLDRGQVLGLIDACDVYVSLHRAEGFGRTLAEAMLLGKPVVATDFSGNTDFLTQEVGFPVRWSRREVQAGDYLFIEPDDGAWWAQPDIGHAAQQMMAARLATQDSAFLAKLKEHAGSAFSPTLIGTRMRERLEEIWQATGVKAPVRAAADP